MKSKTKVMTWIFALLLVCSVLCFATTTGFNRNVMAQESEKQFTMVDGASIRLGEPNGLMFRATISEVDEQATYGMVIVPTDWLTGNDITSDYVNKLDELCSKDANDVYETYLNLVYPTDTLLENGGTIQAAIVKIKDSNITRNFTGIAYERTGSVGAYSYLYATAGDNSRNVFDVASKALLDEKVSYSNAQLDYLNGILAKEDYIQLAKRVDLDVYHMGNTFNVDLTSIEEDLGELTSATINNKAFATASIDNGVVTLDKATLGTMFGNYNVTLNFANKTVVVPVRVISMVIKTETDLANWQNVAVTYANGTANKLDGLFVLGNKIIWTGANSYVFKGSNNRFYGTFDGQGYAIDGFTMSGVNNFIRGMNQAGVIKNLAFTNATSTTGRGFLLCVGYGTIENLYIEMDSITLNGQGSSNPAAATAVIASQAQGITLNNVFVKYGEIKEGSNTYGGQLFGKIETNTKLNGVYALGVDSIVASSYSFKESDVYGAYTDETTLKAQVNFSTWDNDFWDIVDGLPIPETLKQVVVEKEITLNSTIDVDVYHSGTTFNLDITSIKDEIGYPIASATIENIAFSTCNESNGIITLDKATLGALFGEKTIVCIFTDEVSTITVNIPVRLISMVIKTEAELANWQNVAITYANGTANKLDGLFVLGNKITWTGANSYVFKGGDYRFYGTFDGQGYAIDGFTMSGTNNFIRGMNQAGIIKNLAFTNATSTTGRGFLLCMGYGTIENLYIEMDSITLNGKGSDNPAAATAVIASQAQGITLNNVFVKYGEIKEGSNTYGGQLFGKIETNTKINGVYALGVDSIVASSYSFKESDVYGAYVDENTLKAQVNFSTWDNEFWDIVNGLPVPEKLINQN